MPTEQEILRELVAKFMRVPAGSLTADMPLKRFEERSMEWFALLSALQRQLHAPSLATVPPTVGALEAIVLHNGGGSNGSTPAPPQMPAARPTAKDDPPARALPMRIGIDIEDVDTLPPAKDVWEHEFYRAAFTNTEIAYCLSQERPPMHFAGLWAAKEALLKCSPSLPKDRLSVFEVAHEAGGQPYFRRPGDAAPLPYALSISHTGSTAVAVAASVPTVEAPAVTAPPRAPETAARAPRRHGSIVPLLLAAASLLVSLIALLRR